MFDLVVLQRIQSHAQRVAVVVCLIQVPRWVVGERRKTILLVFLLLLFGVRLLFRGVESGSYLGLSVRDIVGTWACVVNFRLLDLVFASKLETSRHGYHFGVIFSRA